MPRLHGKPLVHGAVAETNVSPAGVGSVSIALVAAALPELFTTIMYVMLLPAVMLAGPDFWMVRFGAPTVVEVLPQCGSPAVQLPGVGGPPPLFGSPPPPTEALFVTLPTAAEPTVTGIVIALVPLVAASTAELVQLTLWPVTVHVHGALVNDVAVIPVGKVSSTVMVPDVAVAPVFVTVSVYTGCGEDWFAVHGPFEVLVTPRLGWPFTVRVAVAVLPVPPLVELTAPVVLTAVPATLSVTFTPIVQEPPATSAPPDRLMLPDPTVAVSEPPQELPGRPVATVIPAGIASVNARPASAALTFGLVRVNVNVVLPFATMLAGLNALATLGAKVAEILSVSVAELLPGFGSATPELTVAVFDKVPVALALTVALTV